MNKSRLLVSVIVPMYNAEQFISEALISILREKETLIEVIVVNDKSADRSVDRVREFHDDRIRVIEGPGRGISACMNAGLAEARGAIIMRCDADDVYPQDRIRKQVSFLEMHDDYDAVCGAFSTIDLKGNIIVASDSGVGCTDISN